MLGSIKNFNDNDVGVFQTVVMQNTQLQKQYSFFGRDYIVVISGPLDPCKEFYAVKITVSDFLFHLIFVFVFSSFCQIRWFTSTKIALVLVRVGNVRIPDSFLFQTASSG